MIEVVVFTAFGLLLASIAWWTWKQRQQARHQISMDAQLTALGKEVRGIAHDLNNLLAAMVPNVRLARDVPPEQLPDVLDTIERSAETADLLVQLLRGRRDAAVSDDGSAEGVVRLAVMLLQSQRVRIRLRVMGDLEYSGPDVDALRVVQNLIANAAREAMRVEGGEVSVELVDGELRIVNPLRDPSKAVVPPLGQSGSGSTGLGLTIAEEAASRIGWALRHEVHGSKITFYVTAGSRPAMRAADQEAPS